MRPQSYALLLATLGFHAAAQAHIPPVDNQYRPAVVVPAVAQPSAKYVLTSTYLAAQVGSAPLIAAPFQSFTKNVSVRWDDTYLYVEAKGLPDHPLMTGIKSWQQQVPIPQNYLGANAWRIPLKPVPAKEPMSAKTHFMRGAIALAANGVPIFNALNNRGDDAKAFGELDDFGGHCGKADDYHYHDAPVFLEKQVGKGKPIAVALDGYAIYGYGEPDGSNVGKLDDFGGHETKALGYHYHAQKKYPYINGGFHGEVKEVDGQVDPQPSASHVRREGSSYSQSPLRGALIKEFTTDGKKYALTYTLNGKTLGVKYTLNEDKTWTFVYSKPDGTTATETYAPSERGPGGKGGEKGKGKGKGGEKGKRPPPTDGAANLSDLEVATDAANEVNPPPAGEGKGKKGKGGKKGDKPGMAKPAMEDTLKLNVYADNWFILYINGKLRVVDPIDYMPHNVVSVDILPEYPMTIAIMGRDNADPKTGLEYGDHIGDAGLILKFSDGTVTDAKWKAKSYFKGPLNGDVKNPKVEHTPLPANWFAVDFDDSKWANATEYTEERVNPKESFTKAKESFAGARFIWSDNLDLDNTVIFRTRVEAPAGYKQRWNTKAEFDISKPAGE
jgi:YD repeat-containing protein